MGPNEFIEKFRMSPEERQRRDEEIERDAAEARKSERPLVEEIRAAGWDVDSLWDLVNLHTDHSSLVPLLIHHLPKDYHPKVKMAIARSLISVREKSEDCSRALITELKRALLKFGGQWEGVQQSLTHALAKLAHPAVAEEVEILARDYKDTFLGEDLANALKRVRK